MVRCSLQLRCCWCSNGCLHATWAPRPSPSSLQGVVHDNGDDDDDDDDDDVLDAANVVWCHESPVDTSPQQHTCPAQDGTLWSGDASLVRSGISLDGLVRSCFVALHQHLRDENTCGGKDDASARAKVRRLEGGDGVDVDVPLHQIVQQTSPLFAPVDAVRRYLGQKDDDDDDDDVGKALMKAESESCFYFLRCPISGELIFAA